MSHTIEGDHLSDEEVFFGKLSLNEIKRHILWNNHHRINKYTNASSKENFDNDIKIIETHSAPNLIQKEKDLTNKVKPVSCTSLSPNGPEAYSNWDVKPVDDSFLKVEQLVEDLCDSPEKIVKKDELNNTLDIIDYILKNGAPNTCKSVSNKPSEGNQLSERLNSVPKTELNTQTAHAMSNTPSRDLQLKSEPSVIPKSPAYFTPTKKLIPQISEKFVTPSTGVKQKTPMFKTPANPLSVKKPSTTSLKKTPIKPNSYQHIASPVASYIKNCPVAPLVKDVRPTKPLPGTSSIPKYVCKNPTTNKPSNKENVNLPSVAYKSAKKTQVIEMPDEEKLPQCQLMKKITSSLPKPLIMKHNHRETNLIRKVMGSRQENSFADLSLRQADVSVCTQKSAFNRPKKEL